MDKSYVLVADAHRARCFEWEAQNKPLLELEDFIAPHTLLNSLRQTGDLTGEAGKGHGRTAHAGTQFEPHTEVADKDRAAFAQELANYLNSAVTRQLCKSLVVIATGPMLGDLRSRLNPAASRVLKRTVTKDLTHYTDPELTERVRQALQVPA